MVTGWLSHSQLYSKAGRRGLLESFSLYLKKKVFPRSPHRLPLRSYGSELDHMLPLNQSLIKKNEIIPYDWLWRIMVHVLGLSFLEYIAVLYLKEKKSRLHKQGRSGKWLMGRQSTMCHSLSLGLSRWLPRGKGSGRRSLRAWKQVCGAGGETPVEGVVCSQPGGLIRDHYAGFWAN